MNDVRVRYKDAIEVLELGLALGGDIHESIADDGKITLGDVMNFSDTLKELPDAIEGMDQVPSQFKALMRDRQGIVEVSKIILEKMPGIGTKWETVALESFNIGMSVLKIVDAFRS